MKKKICSLGAICLILLSACQNAEQHSDTGGSQFDAAKLDRIEEAAERSHQDTLDQIESAKSPATNDDQPAEKSTMLHRWIVNHQFSGCPEVSDWFKMQEILQSGDRSKYDQAILPSRCTVLIPGTHLIAPPKEQRETYVHNGHEYESFSLEDGTKLWGDGMDDFSTSDLGPIN